MKPVLEICPKEIDLLDRLIILLLSSAVRSYRDLEDVRRQHFKSIMDDMLAGKTYNQASAGHEFLNLQESEFRELMRRNANDLAFQVATVTQDFAIYWNTGLTVAPYYPKRIAIILRKARLYDLEIDFLIAASRHLGDFMPGRLLKTQALAAKAAR